jgi:2Fe-2S ferredoxin
MMINIIFEDLDGNQKKITVPVHQTLMEAAVRNNIEGIDADCGGACACSTCHVYIPSEYQDKLPKLEDHEDDMLDFAYERNSNSRLACQIELTEALDGLTAIVPRRQK